MVTRIELNRRKKCGSLSDLNLYRNNKVIIPDHVLLVKLFQ